MQGENKMIRNLLLMLTACSIVAICGCKSNEITVIESDHKVEMKSGAFNEEHYVWESFLFPTNRTTGVQ